MARQTFVKHFDTTYDATKITLGDIPEHNHNHYIALNKIDYSWSERRKWFGADDSADVSRLVREGWQDGVDQMLAAFSQIGADLQATSVKRTLVRGAYGDELDIHRVNSGSLGDAWISRKRVRRQAPTVITIACNLGLSAQQRPEELFWRGAAVLRMADLLTDAGYAVEIAGFNLSERVYADGSDSEIVTFAKHSGDPLDLNAVASVICLSGFFRLFHLQAKCLNPKQKTQSTMGSPDRINVPKSLAGAIVAPATINNKELAEDWLRNELYKLEQEQGAMQ